MTKRKDNEMVDVTFELVPTEGKVRKPRKKLTHAEEVAQMLRSPEVSMRLRGYWCKAYEKRWGFEYNLNARTRELKHFGDMGRSWGEEAVQAVVDLFFGSTDPRVVRSNYTVADLNTHAARLRMAQQPGGDINEKSMGNIHEISKAMGRKP